MSEEEFLIRLPSPFPPPFPPPGAHGNVMFVSKGGDSDGPEGKAHEDIMLRRVPHEIAMRFRGGAGGRGLTHAQYLAALVELHTRLRQLAETGDATARAELDALGLATVTV